MSKPIIAVVGETASGKSAAAMEIARRFNGELIAADSRTVYRGMDIGTAKPSPEDQAEIPHHMLDIAEPDAPFNVSEFQKLAQEAIKDILSRGKLPIIVGGTGLYTDSILFDYSFGDDGATDQRKELDEMTVPQLLVVAQKADIQIHATDIKNKRYIIRSIEKHGRNNNDRAQMIENALVVGIKLQRNALRKRIEDRVEIQFKQGLRKELDELVQRFGWDHEALTGIGYREFRLFYEGNASMSKVKRQIVQDTLQYAKRQRTWFKRNPQIQWYEDSTALLEKVSNVLESNSVK